MPKKKPPASKPVNARAIAAKLSWAIPEVAAKRSMRYAVRVCGKWYTSIRMAFKALGFPDEHHHEFRQRLVKAGRAKYGGKLFVARRRVT